MIKQITWEEILPIWQNKLWAGRTSPIETNSAMKLLNGHDMYNMSTTATFFGYVMGEWIIGVNSGHGCSDGTYRSRGLWVDTNYRNQGIGTKLLVATYEQGLAEGCSTTWSYPRLTSWPTYQQAGFELVSNWEVSETSDSNAYAKLFKS
jgi:GNAT superfamily N-acetyltransferase